MAELKTKKTNASVKAFLSAIENDTKREDCFQLLGVFERITGEKAAMWGDSIVGFGSYRYTNTQGGGEWPITGFSPRARNISIYIMNGFSKYGDLMAKLGKHKAGRSCLYVNKLIDVELDVLERLVKKSSVDMKKAYPVR